MGDAPNKESVSDIEMVNEYVIDPAIRNVSIPNKEGVSDIEMVNGYVIDPAIRNVRDSFVIYQQKRALL